MVFNVTNDFVTDTATNATDMNKNFEDVENLVNGDGSNYIVPIGAIIAWAKTMTSVPALPSNFAECDGTDISDADSPMNGETLPDLNGGEFLRGDATSGGTGGSDTMAHTHGFTTGSPSATFVDGQAPGPDAGAGTHTHTGSTGAASEDENRPPYYNVVWVMRIK